MTTTNNSNSVNVVKDVLVPCPGCRGTKVQELNGGLHTRPCLDCKGKGEVKPEHAASILKREKDKEDKAQRDREQLQAAMKVNRAPTPRKPVTKAAVEETEAEAEVEV